MAKSRHKALNEIATRSQMAHWKARNLLMLEAVIAAMLDVDDHRAVATILREHADQLEEYM